MHKVKIIFALFYISFTISLNAQNSGEVIVYDWYDQLVGYENLTVNNGKIHTNYDITLNNDHRYFKTSEFIIGNLKYENQDYFNQKLKYDIYKDLLVLSPKNETEYIKINIISQNVESFTLLNKKFIWLNHKGFKGFFEENFVGKNKIFYVKHFKESKELLQSTRLYVQYFYKQKYILFYNGIFTEINSRKSIVKIFPNYESKINDFYDSNENLRKENEFRFMENLIKFINNFS